MKRTLGLGEGYALTKHKLKHPYIRYISLLAVLTSMCLYARGQRPTQIWSGRPLGIILSFLLAIGFNANAQFYEPSALSKSAGDMLPDSFFETPHQAIHAQTGNQTLIKLSEYRDKLIILDFWATWCKPCIGSLNKLDSLQRSMDTTKFIIVPVTYQTAQEAAPAFERFAWDMTSVVSDTMLARIFPHSGIPHMIWIKDGKVLANPMHYYATKDVIEDVIADRYVAFGSQKRKFDVDLLVDNIPQHLTLYKSAILKGAPDYHQQSPEFLHRDGKTILFLGNVELLKGLFGYAYGMDISPHFRRSEGAGHAGISIETNENVKQILMEPKPLLRDFQGPVTYRKALDEWKSRNYFSYLLIIDSLVTREEALHHMKRDVSSYFQTKLGIQPKIEKRGRELAVLKVLTSTETTLELLETNGGQKRYDLQGERSTVVNVPYQSVPSTIVRTKILPQGLPLIDETGIAERIKDREEDYRIDLSIPFGLDGNITAANKYLAPYGLKLEIENRMVPILIIQDTPNTSAN